MLEIIKKIVSFIMSIYMLLFNIPSNGEPVVPENADVIINNDGINTSGEYIFETYAEFLVYLNLINKSDEMKKYADEIGNDFFFENNLAIIDVALSNGGESVVVVSLEESGNQLDVKYIINKSPLESIDVICYDSICVKTSKTITKINSTELSSQKVIAA